MLCAQCLPNMTPDGDCLLSAGLHFGASILKFHLLTFSYECDEANALAAGKVGRAEANEKK